MAGGIACSRARSRDNIGGVRGVLFLAALGGLCFLALKAWERLPHPAPAVSPAQARTVAKTKLSECRDACEQRAIVEQLDEKVMRACRARCDAEGGAGQGGAAAAGGASDHPPIKRITRAPADHRRITPLPRTRTPH